MPTIDGDWECDQDDFECGCFAVWDSCTTCLPYVSDICGYEGGLVPVGQGLPIEGERGNLWFEQYAELVGKYDICPTCTGSGGGYICGVHDLKEKTP